MNNYFFKATLLAFLVIADSGTLMSKNNHVLKQKQIQKTQNANQRFQGL